VEDPSARRERKRIVDNGCFQFERPMKTGKIDIETAMIRIPITDKDIDKTKGEALPEGGFVRVLHMILTEETPDVEDCGDSPIRFNETSRTANLGKLVNTYFFVCVTVCLICYSHTLYFIESMSNLDPLATLQEGLNEIEREITNYMYIKRTSSINSVGIKGMII
jgi:hypothetical protein